MSKYKEGDVLECLTSSSNAYKVGKTYKVTKHPMTDQLCLVGSDGFYDPLGVLVSKFKKVAGEVIQLEDRR